MQSTNDLTLKERLQAKSPKLFQKLTNIGLTIGAIGGALVALPASGIVIPAGLVTIGGYMIATGAVTSAVSKLTVDPAEITQ